MRLADLSSWFKERALGTVFFIPHRDAMIAVSGTPRKLTPKQSRLLEILLTRKGPVPFEDIISHLWPDPDERPDGDWRPYLFRIMGQINCTLEGTACQIKGLRGFGFELVGPMKHEAEWRLGD